MKSKKKFCAAVCLLVLTSLSAPALAQTATEIQKDLGQLQTQIQSLESRVIKPELVAAEFGTETRFNDARVAHGLGQYDTSNSLFLAVVTRTTPTSFSGHRQALYLLGDGLAKSRNTIGARTFLNQLVSLGEGPYYQEALGLLLEVAFATSDYRGLNEVYAKLNSQQSLSASVSYLRGKTQFQQKNYDEARKDFAQAATDPSLFYVATYYSATADVAQKKYDDAQKKFAALVAKRPTSPRDLKVFHLSNLALGRLAYEQGKFEESLLFYNRLPRTNENFGTMLYEASWSLVQLKRYDAARQNIEIMIYSNPAPDLYTKAMLLRADLSLRVNDYDTALSAFEDVLARYNPVREQMVAFEKKHADLPAFFQTLVNDKLQVAVPPELPSIKTEFGTQAASQWLGEGRSLKRVSLLSGDVGRARAEIAAARKDLDEIDARLNSNTLAKSFPSIASGLGQAASIEADLIAARRAILKRQEQLLSASLNASEKQQLAKEMAALAKLEADYNKTPTTLKGLNNRDEKVEVDFAKLNRKVDEMSFEIRELQAQAKAIDVYMQTQSLSLSMEDQKVVETERAGLREDIAALERQRDALKRELDVAKQDVGYGSVLSPSEATTRQMYRDQMDRVYAIFAGAQGRSGVAELNSLGTLWAAIPAQERKLMGFKQKLNAAVDRQVAEIRQQANNERVLLETQAQSLGLLSGDTRQAVAKIAYRNFVDKKQDFERIVLKADVGKVDVLFQSKEDASQEINALFQERTNKLKALQESFEDVR